MTNSPTHRKVAILGASRGLGRAIAERLQQTESVESLLCVSRKPASGETTLSKSEFFEFDLSKPDLSDLIQKLNAFAPDCIFYCAGGGPFSNYQQAKWSAHQWALRVSFLAAAEICHWFLGQQGASKARQMVMIGSSVAESQGDAQAASYAAAKHALLGLYQSIQKEKPKLDLRLFSPGYMNTDMIPAGSWPRQQSQSLWEPDHVASMLCRWCSDDAQFGGHMSLSLFADTPRKAH
ncbi:MAG: SDR family oxidoreductase [Bdellovibrionales bacterium]|nr:SDR family oxidoreductase [Bdellovibrionales bacterium]